MHHNPYGASLAIQISLLIIAPTFFSAGLYLTLKHIILAVEPRLSLLRPQMYTWIFISADIVSLLLQASGGGIESTASSSGDPDRLTIGNDMMMAGIIFQVVTLTIFFLLAAHFFWRVFSHGGKQNSSPDVSILSDRKFLFFISAMTVTFTTIYVRCVYR